MTEFKSKHALALAGLAAVTECLNTIGREGSSDHDLAKVFVENEIEIRCLLEEYVTKTVLVHNPGC